MPADEMTVDESPANEVLLDDVPPDALIDVAGDEPPMEAVSDRAEDGPAEREPTSVPALRWRRVLLGRPDDATWVRPALLTLLAATGVLYIWGLGESGWANSFYSAAVQAGTKSWKAFFFGSSDASNFITVDKPPASLWVMEISARIFGVNAWSILVPQALEGVAVVAVLYATVRRWFSAGAGLVAGAVMAVTPVAALMFRFNNPDALLVLVLVIAAYALTRALEDGSTTWLVVASALIGLGFITKMLQSFVVVPGFAVVYLIAGPPRLRKRLWQLLVSGAAMFVSSAWWVAVVELSPKSWRPYAGGSSNNSELNLIFGYNGLGRVTGNERGSVGGFRAPNTNGQWGETGLLRMFNNDFGGQSSWLIPAALLFGAAGLVITLRRPRTDRTRAALLLWGGWLVVTGVVLSLSKGIIHPYYTVALAPAIGALIGIGGHLLWQHRSHLLARLVAAAGIGVSAWWAVVLLDRSPTFKTWLHPLVVVAAIVAAVAIVVAPLIARATSRLPVGRAVGAVGIAAALVAALAAPTAYSIDTASVPHSGSIPSAGPAVTVRRSTLGGVLGGPPFVTRNPSTGQRNGVGPGNGAGPGNGVGPGNGPGQGGFPPLFGNGNGRPPAPPTGGLPGPGGSPRKPGGQGGGANPNVSLGSLLSSSRPSAGFVAALREHADRYRWVLATIGANQAAGYQLASGDPVMAIGGFNGTDPAPSLVQFQQYVAARQIHYFIGGGFSGPGSTGGEITAWVRQHFAVETVGGIQVYDLTASLG